MIMAMTAIHNSKNKNDDGTANGNGSNRRENKQHLDPVGYFVAGGRDMHGVPQISVPSSESPQYKPESWNMTAF